MPASLRRADDEEARGVDDDGGGDGAREDGESGGAGVQTAADDGCCPGGGECEDRVDAESRDDLAEFECCWRDGPRAVVARGNVAVHGAPADAAAGGTVVDAARDGVEGREAAEEGVGGLDGAGGEAAAHRVAGAELAERVVAPAPDAGGGGEAGVAGAGGDGPGAGDGDGRLVAVAALDGGDGDGLGGGSSGAVVHENAGDGVGCRIIDALEARRQHEELGAAAHDGVCGHVYGEKGPDDGMKLYRDSLPNTPDVGLMSHLSKHK